MIPHRPSHWIAVAVVIALALIAAEVQGQGSGTSTVCAVDSRHGMNL